MKLNQSIFLECLADSMFLKPSERLEKYRLFFPGFLNVEGQMSGAFQWKYLRIIASSPLDYPEESDGWEHVSVSTATRCPTWNEMCIVKDLFWPEEEAVFQLHPPKSQWISNHPFCLHMWRNEKYPFQMPPGIMVGIKKDGEYKNKAEAEAGFKRAKERGEI